MAKARRQKPKRFDLDDYEPFRLTSNPDAEPFEADDDEDTDDTMVAFYIDDRAFRVPTRVPFNVSPQAMRIYATSGDAAVTNFLMERVLGEEAYGELIANEGLTRGQYDSVGELVNAIVNASGKDQ